jgi:hypothetical protein
MQIPIEFEIGLEWWIGTVKFALFDDASIVVLSLN